jgi:hypothetical protein
MSETLVKHFEIEVEVSGFFTTHHHFQTEAGSLGAFTFPAFSQQGTYHTADRRKLLMQKTHWLGTAHEFVDGDLVRGTADRPGLFRQDIAIRFDGLAYSLQPEGLFKQGWFLLDAQGNTLLEFQPRGVFKQGAYITVWQPVSEELLAFAYYLVHMRKQEQAAAVAATSTAATS